MNSEGAAGGSAGRSSWEGAAGERPLKGHAGVIVPMVTPLTAQGRVDGGAAERIAERLIAGGCHPFVLGTTGEGASLALGQAAGLVARVASRTAGRARLYAGISTNSLASAVEMGRRFLEAGADAVVAHPPSYFPIDAVAMQRYFELLADGLSGPLLLYNIPVTTNLSIPLEVVERLSRHPHIVGLKDSESNPRRLEEAIGRWSGRPDFVHLVGSAPDAVYGLELGSDGLVPSAGNLVPRLYSLLYDAARRGEFGEAARLQAAAEELSALYTGHRSVPESIAALKVMMAAWDLCEPHLLPPLFRMPLSAEQEIRARLSRFDRQALETGTPPRARDA